MPATPSLRQRVEHALEDNPLLSLREIAIEAGCHVETARLIKRQLDADERRQAPATPCQPVMPQQSPAFPPFDRGWQHESPAAARLCAAYCPIREQCLAQALSKRTQLPGVLGGLTLAERLALLAERRLERTRATRRNGERLRTRLGLNAQYQRDRYKQDPAPKKAANASYYERNAERIKAARRAHYEANREAICTAKREAYRAR
jgi:hypothetical protein